MKIHNFQILQNFLSRWVMLILVLGTFQSFAQEALRMDLAGTRAAAGFGRAKSTPDYYNILCGPVTFRLSAAETTEYSDNVLRSSQGGGSDFIFTPTFTVNGTWAITEKNTLRIGMTAGYIFYSRN